MNRLLLIAGILGASGVLLGAFGAHGLEGALTRGMAEIDPVWLAKRLDQFDVGVRYHLLHAVALLVLALSGDAVTPRLRTVTGVFWIVGVLVFSGLLYALVLTNTPWLGAIVPIGGVSLTLGWLTIGLAAVSRRSASANPHS